MSTDHLPELPPDALAAVRDARRITPPADAVRARMRSRLLSALPPLPGGGEGGPGDPSPPPPAAAPGVAGLPRVPLWTVAAALAAGLTAGLLYPRAPVERVLTVAGPPLVASVASAPPPASTLAAIALNDLPSIAPSSSAPAAIARSGNDLEAERALLDVARTALGRGDGANALTACEGHARRFPRGALGEEREAIAVQALVLEQRGEDARLRAERFRRAYPRSILLPAVLAAAGIEL